MQLFTLAQIVSKLSYDADIFDGDFVDLTTELPGYINEAIDDAEAIIHTLYEDYFLTRSTISLVSGTAQYSTPSDIYGAKIRGVYYNNGSKKYEIKRIKKLQTLLEIDSNAEQYQYLLLNGANTESTGSFKLEFHPTPQETSTYAHMFYIRNAKRLSSNSDYCDIPEFINFIYAHVKHNLAAKEKIGLDLNVAEKRLITQKSLMESTLANMVPDEGNLISPDISFYQDFDDNSIASEF